MTDPTTSPRVPAPTPAATSTPATPPTPPASAGGGSGAAGPPLPPWMPPEVPAKYRHSGWRTVAHDRYQSLGTQAAVGGDGGKNHDAQMQLEAAHAAFQERSLGGWWTGSVQADVESHLDLAELALASTTDSDIANAAPVIRSRIKRRFRATDVRRVTALGLLEGTPTAEKVREALGLLHAGTLDLRMTQLSRRNRSLIFAALFAVAAVALAWSIDDKSWTTLEATTTTTTTSTTTTTAAPEPGTGAGTEDAPDQGSASSGATEDRSPGSASSTPANLVAPARAAVPLDTTPQGDASSKSEANSSSTEPSPTEPPGTSEPAATPSTPATPSPSTAASDATDPPEVPSPWGVMMMGAVGGVLSLFSLNRRAGGPSRAANAALVQAGLKISAGALVALVAAIFVQHATLDLVQPQTSDALMGWAIAFGYSQDAVTKRFDSMIGDPRAPASVTTEDEPSADDDSAQV